MQYFIAILIQNSALTTHISHDVISYQLAYVTSNYKQKNQAAYSCVTLSHIKKKNIKNVSFVC